ncbi:hypothetical protein HFN11_14545 [Rhizobium leguminosarum]|uniref:hypothetical protein n=1 Tax=Rhizobium leguminosarum TaxID=384 RepID=UPI001C985052|nr:hypothetical protein [Rhizobium leguminosarum]MBY5321492.1 hypothetical protein [Rhizobium leguminosarum]
MASRPDGRGSCGSRDTKVQAHDRDTRYGARKDQDETWSIFDRRTGLVAERSGLIMARLNQNVVLGLIQILEQIEDAPKRLH